MSCGGCVSVRGLRAGLRSRAFTARDLLLALRDLDPARTVWVDVDGAGWVAAGARVCVGARLAPHVLAAHAVLAAADSGGLQLVVVRELAPHQELLLWFAEGVRAAVLLPHLAPHNIRGGDHYECGECGARFQHPNPLKTHLLLRCAAPDPATLWRLLAARLASCPPDTEPAAACGGPPHACVYCGKHYSRRYGLKIHLRTHTGHRPLRCRHCARAFADPSNLNKHVRLHARRDTPARRHVTAPAGNVQIVR